MNRIVATLILGAVGFNIGAQTPNASVAGSVVSDAGSPVPGALVSVTAVPTTSPPAVGFTAASANVFAGGDGTFSVTNLAPGKYQLCAQVKRTVPLLDPCVWGQTQTYVTLTAGQAAKGAKVTMPTGALLQLHINDPAGLLLANDRKTPGADLLVTVARQNSPPVPFFVDATTGTGRDHSIVVPMQTALKVNVSSGFYQITDSAGKAVAGTNTVPVNVVNALVPQIINVNITGLKAR